MLALYFNYSSTSVTILNKDLLNSPDYMIRISHFVSVISILIVLLFTDLISNLAILKCSSSLLVPSTHYSFIKVPGKDTNKIRYK
jgi:hypothetical protein